jgi:hypothetical protein
MELSDFYPRPEVLIKSELAILEYLKTNRYITQQHPRFAQDAHNKYGLNRSHTAIGFDFLSYLDVWHPTMHKRSNSHPSQASRDPNTRLILGTRLQVNDSKFVNITYCFVVCRLRGERSTIHRKFHFDIAVNSDESGQRSQNQPRCHLQYCGEMVPQMAGMGCKESQLEQMHPWLSEPRIFFWPMSLGLLIDMSLREFDQRSSAAFRATPEWRGLVRRQESLILKPFYEKCLQVIKNNSKEARTLLDEFTLN